MAKKPTKLTLRLRFQFRPGSKALSHKPRSLYIFLSLNGFSVPGYTSGVQVAADQWDQRAQQVRGRGEEARLLNNQLQAIRDEHFQLLETQRRERFLQPTAHSIRMAWRTPPDELPRLAEAYAVYLAHVRAMKGTTEGKAPATLIKWQNGLRYLRAYIKKKHGGAKDIPMSLVNIGWAKAYLAYLTGLTTKAGKPQLGANSAIRLVKYLKPVLDYQVELTHLEINPLLSLQLRRAPEKPIVCLEDHHLSRLAGLTLAPSLAEARDIMQLLCFTGMDLKDLRQFLKKPGRHLVATLGGGHKISIQRGKTGSDCQIPVLEGVLPLIERYGGQKLPSEGHINRQLKLLAIAVDFAHPLTCKVCRKTAGTLFLNAGYSLEVVQAVLGHKSIKMTQTHYAKLLDKRVDAEMRRVGPVVVPVNQPPRFLSLQA